MKNLFLFLTIASFALFTSCNQVKDAAENVTDGVTDAVETAGDKVGETVENAVDAITMPKLESEAAGNYLKEFDSYVEDFKGVIKNSENVEEDMKAFESRGEELQTKGEELMNTLGEDDKAKMEQYMKAQGESLGKMIMGKMGDLMNQAGGAVEKAGDVIEDHTGHNH